MERWVGPDLLSQPTRSAYAGFIWYRCIFLELFVKKPTFQGNDEIHQLEVVFRLLGTPSIESWAGLSSLPWYELIKPGEVMEGHFRHSFRK